MKTLVPARLPCLAGDLDNVNSPDRRFLKTALDYFLGLGRIGLRIVALDNRPQSCFCFV